MSNLNILVQSAGQSSVVGHGIESRAVPDRYSEDRNRSQSLSVQGCSTDIGWGQRGSSAAHCHPSPGTTLGRAGGGLWAHCQVWEIGYRCRRLDGRHRCCGPVLTVTCCYRWNIK